MAERFGQRPSKIWGIADREFALAFDRTIHLRLMLLDAEIAKARAEALENAS